MRRILVTLGLCFGIAIAFMLTLEFYFIPRSSMTVEQFLTQYWPQLILAFQWLVVVPVLIILYFSTTSGGT